ncbi:hypothetical protein [Flexivirga caeni]|uniref:hypothetical protein n=1 Tax=Flexivirga caeni TaxID=2294115 RepID=UPI001315164C|nr:hypothetical protein [Flexivirga caeni]
MSLAESSLLAMSVVPGVHVWREGIVWLVGCPGSSSLAAEAEKWRDEQLRQTSD